MSTARTLGVYLYMAVKGSPTSSNDLAKAFGGDRKTYLKDLQTLVHAGLVTMNTQVVNGRPITVTSLSDESPLNGLQILLSELNSPLTLNAYSFISKKESFDESKKEQTMNDEYEPEPMWLDPEERAERAKRNREKRSATYRAAKDAEALKKIEEMRTRTPDDWTVSDSVHYFGDCMIQSWRIQPWLGTRTNFRAAFGKNRKMFGTTGDIEKKMIDRFFESIAHNKKLDDPEATWRLFLKQFSALHIEVLRTTVTDDDKQRAIDVAREQWDNF